jgi:hypothetical protein
VRRDPFRAFAERLQKAVAALKGDVELDTQEFSFIAYPNKSFTIQTNAYRQLQRFLLGRIGERERQIPYSERYLRWRQRVGLPGTTWTLVKTGILYSTLRYVVKKGELFVEFSDERKVAVRGLNLTAKFHVLKPTPQEVREMASEVARKRLVGFIQALLKK